MNIRVVFKVAGKIIEQQSVWLSRVPCKDEGIMLPAPDVTGERGYVVETVIHLPEGSTRAREFGVPYPDAIIEVS